MIHTKLHPPLERKHTLLRPRLLTLLRRSESSTKVTLIQAAAGFGKTTLLSQWISCEEEATVYFSFDYFETIASLFRYLITGFQRIHFETLGLKNVSQLAGYLSTVEQPFTLVLDDYHVHEDPDIHRFIELLCHRLPENGRLVIVTRHPLELSLARMRMSGELNIIDNGELRFQRREAEELLRHLEPTRKSSEIEVLFELTEGWPAATLLLGQSSELMKLHSGGLNLDNSSRSKFAKELFTEVLKTLSDSLQTCLIALSLLDRFTLDLAARVCSEEQVRGLDLDSWFIVQSDVEWYRFHHLFSHFLRERARATLARSEKAQVHRLAGEWFEEFSHVEEAIQHCLQGQDWSRASALLKDPESLSGLFNWYRSSQDWFKIFPKAAMDRTLYARLGVVFWSAYDPEKAYHAFTKGLGSETPSVEFLCLSGLSLSAHSLGSFQKARELLDTASSQVPVEETPSKAIGLYLLAATSLLLGQANRAKGYLERCESRLVIPRDECPVFFEMISALSREYKGQYQEAILLHLDVLERSEALGHKSQMKITHGFLARCYYQVGELAAAGRQWEQYHTISHSNLESMMQRLFFPAFILYLDAVGNVKEANQLLQNYCSGKLKHGDEYTRSVLSLKYEKRLSTPKEDDYFLNLWGLLKMETVSESYFSYQMYLSWIARLLNTPTKCNLKLCFYWLEQLTSLAELEGRFRDIVELKLLQSRCLYLTGELESAKVSASNALRKGLSLGLTAVFLEQPGEFLRFLKELEERVTGLSKDWLKIALLSEREQEVLELLSMGLTNKQISEELFVSINTIKWYNQKIFKKLGIKSRSEIADSLPLLKQAQEEG